MAINYEWKIEQMEAYPQYEGHSDVVFTCHWRLNANEGNYNATSYGSVGVTLDPDSDFVPYANLTQAEVVNWVKDALGEEQVSQIETGLAGQIENLKNPPVVRPELPWTQAAE
jgi:hypothetical protein